MKNIKTTYLPPTVEFTEFKVERGFCTSSGDYGDGGTGFNSPAYPGDYSF